MNISVEKIAVAVPVLFMVGTTMFSSFPPHGENADKLLPVSSTSPHSLSKQDSNNAISYSTFLVYDRYKLDSKNRNANLIDQYKNRLSGDQIRLLSELMGSESLIDSASVDRFDYPSV